MTIADSGASHMILPQTALYDTQAAKPVSLRLAAGQIKAVEAHREIFAEHVTIPAMPTRTRYTETPAYGNLDTSDFDFELCEQIRYCTGTDAMSN